MQCNITIIAAMELHSATIYIGWWLVSLDFFSTSLEQVLATSVFSFASLTRKGPLGHKTALKASQRSFKALKQTVYGGSGA